MTRITTISKAEYTELMQVWEASVRATHHFLKEEDILFFRKVIPEQYLDAVRLYAIHDMENAMLGFLGVSDDSIEMLFIHPDARGKGIGSALLDYAVNNLHLRKVDVNEQNEQAVGFYLHKGFSVIGRSELDSTGKPYPILHLEKPRITEKSLTGMSNEELWQLFPIILSEHQAHWKDDFRHEAELLKEKIGNKNLENIRHIGSTAIPGIMAKPIIDILLEIKKEIDLNELITVMESIGYIYSPQPHKPEPHMMLMKGYTPAGFQPPVFHVHVRYPGDWDEIYFRDFLLEHPETAKEYENLKLKLKEQFEHDRDGYTEAKKEFVQRITTLAKCRVKEQCFSKKST